MFPAGRRGLSVENVSLANGLTIRVVTSGPATGPVVLLLHGWGGSSYMWRDWFLPLADDGHRVLAPDLPGHGLSSKPDDDRFYTRDALVAFVRELLDAKGVTSVDVVAQSMAGTIALGFAEAHGARVRHIALVNPALFGRVRMERLFKLVSPPVIDAILPRLVRRWIVSRTHAMVYGDPSRLTSEDVDEYWAPSQFPGYARAMRRLLHVFGWNRDDVTAMAARLGPIADRLLVILGTKDRLVLDAKPYVAALHERLPTLTVHEAVGGGHAVNEERPEELVPLVRSFLGDVK